MIKASLSAFALLCVSSSALSQVITPDGTHIPVDGTKSSGCTVNANHDLVGCSVASAGASFGMGKNFIVYFGSYPFGDVLIKFTHQTLPFSGSTETVRLPFRNPCSRQQGGREECYESTSASVNLAGAAAALGMPTGMYDLKVIGLTNNPDGSIHQKSIGSAMYTAPQTPVNVYLHNPNGSPVSGATVRIDRQFSYTIRTGTTNSTGDALFINDNALDTGAAWVVLVTTTTRSFNKTYTGTSPTGITIDITIPTDPNQQPVFVQKEGLPPLEGTPPAGTGFGIDALVNSLRSLFIPKQATLDGYKRLGDTVSNWGVIGYIKQFMSFWSVGGANSSGADRYWLVPVGQFSMPIDLRATTPLGGFITGFRVFLAGALYVSYMMGLINWLRPKVQI